MLLDITITREDYQSNIKVSIQITSCGNEMEIEGRLNSFNTGRCDEFEFEPTWFDDDATSDFYDENSEKIEQAVFDTAYELGF